MNLDMTKGNPFQLIIRFLIPVFLGALFQQFYGLVDTMIVGRVVGEKALAAVGSTGSVSFLIFGFVMGMTTGFTVITGQKFGEKDDAGIQKSVGNAMILSAVITVIGTLISVLLMGPLLKLMQTPEDIYDMAKLYMVIICWGMGFQILYNLIASILRSIGNSRVPLYFLIFSAGLNILLDLLFTVVLKLGVAGAAIATTLAQGISGILCLVYMVKKVDVIHLQKSDFYLDKEMVKKQLHIAIPMAFQFAITASGTMLVQAALNRLGSVCVAANTVASRVEYSASTMFEAIGTTMAAYSAQNWGAGRIDRIRSGQKSAFVICVIYSLACCLLILPFVTQITNVFFTEDISEIIGYVKLYLYICIPFFIPLSMIFIYRNLLQACGYTFAPTMGGMVELICRAVVAVIAAICLSYTGVVIANVSAWFFAGIYLWIEYLIVMKRILKSNESKTA